MRILTSYVLREYLVPLSYCLAGFVSIYVLFELFGSFSRLAAAKPAWTQIVRFFAANGTAAGSQITLDAELSAELFHALIGHPRFFRNGHRQLIQ